MRKRKQALNDTQTKLVAIKKKTEKREATREMKAEKAAQVEGVADGVTPVIGALLAEQVAPRAELEGHDANAPNVHARADSQDLLSDI